MEISGRTGLVGRLDFSRSIPHPVGFLGFESLIGTYKDKGLLLVESNIHVRLLRRRVLEWCRNREESSDGTDVSSAPSGVGEWLA